MTDPRTLEEARAAFDRGAWCDACAQLTAADARTPLDPDDLDRLATAAYLIGEDAASVQARTRAHAGFLERGETRRGADRLTIDLHAVTPRELRRLGGSHERDGIQDG
ncbi:MAG TPA: hypothetical protein VLV78_06485 [Thermoanaerobaculia bacterium]|nr:hypothetical protein [Thermoanaerobaculia bacterium]